MATNGITAMPVEKSKLELLRERKAEREEARRLEEEARELAELEAEELHESKTGKRGVDFEIVSTECGLFVLRKPEFTVAKTFFAVDKPTIEDYVKFIRPCLLSPPEEFAAALQDHGGIASRCMMALLTMYEAQSGARAKKF